MSSIWIDEENRRKDITSLFAEQWKKAREQTNVGPSQWTPVWLEHKFFTQLNRFCANISRLLRYQRVEFLLSPPIIKNTIQNRIDSTPQLVAGAYRNSDHQKDPRILSKIDNWTRGLRKILEFGEPWSVIQKRIDRYSSSLEKEGSEKQKLMNDYIDYSFLATVIAALSGIVNTKESRGAAAIMDHFMEMIKDGQVNHEAATPKNHGHIEVKNLIGTARKSGIKGFSLRVVLRAIIKYNNEKLLFELPITDDFRRKILESVSEELDNKEFIFKNKKISIENSIVLIEKAFSIIEYTSNLSSCGDIALIRKFITDNIQKFSTTAISLLFGAPVTSYPFWLGAGTAISPSQTIILYPNIRKSESLSFGKNNKMINSLSLRTYEFIATHESKRALLPDLDQRRIIHSMILVNVRQEDKTYQWNAVLRLMNRYEPSDDNFRLHMYVDNDSNRIDSPILNLSQYESYKDEHEILLELNKLILKILVDLANDVVIPYSNYFGFGSMVKLPIIKTQDEYPWPIPRLISRQIAKSIRYMENDDSPNVLVIQGMPGTGKFTMAKYLAGRLVNHRSKPEIFNPAFAASGDDSSRCKEIKNIRSNAKFGVLILHEPGQFSYLTQKLIWELFIKDHQEINWNCSNTSSKKKGFLIIVTSVSFELLFHQGKIRSDLFQWFNSFEVMELPSLQGWHNDDVIEALHKHCSYKDPSLELPTLHEETCKALDQWPWPTNLRSLEQLVDILFKNVTRKYVEIPEKIQLEDDNVMEALKELSHLTGIHRQQKTQGCGE